VNDETIHCEFDSFVPADVLQFVVGLVIVDFLISILSTVALLVPATAQPVPGSAPSVPTASINVYVDPLPPFHARPTASLPLKDNAPE